MENAFDSDLAALEQEILESVRVDPERRAIQQRIRGSFAIAEAISDLFNRTRRSREEVSRAAGIDAGTVDDILLADSEAFISLELLSKLATALGYGFQIQMFPAARLTEVKSRDVELVGDGILGGVLIRFESGLQAVDIEREVLGGVRRLVAKAEGITARFPEFLHREEMVQQLLSNSEGQKSGQFMLADLIAVADQLEYKVQLRFSEHVVLTQIKPIRREVTASSTSRVSAIFRSYTTVSS